MLLGKAETGVGKPEEQQATQVVPEMVVQRLVEGKNTKNIVKELVKGGWSKESATQFVISTEQQFKQSPEGRQVLASKHKRGMIYGLLWVAGGTIATVATEGQWLFWGAILFGMFDFFRSFFGWAKYR